MCRHDNADNGMVDIDNGNADNGSIGDDGDGNDNAVNDNSNVTNDNGNADNGNAQQHAYRLFDIRAVMRRGGSGGRVAGGDPVLS